LATASARRGHVAFPTADLSVCGPRPARAYDMNAAFMQLQGSSRDAQVK